MTLTVSQSYIRGVLQVKVVGQNDFETLESDIEFLTIFWIWNDTKWTFLFFDFNTISHAFFVQYVYDDLPDWIVLGAVSLLNISSIVSNRWNKVAPAQDRRIITEHLQFKGHAASQMHHILIIYYFLTGLIFKIN